MNIEQRYSVDKSCKKLALLYKAVVHPRIVYSPVKQAFEVHERYCSE